MWASAHTGEKGRDVIAHWRMAFAIPGIPSVVKTDNGPAYVSQKTRQFLQMWGVSHKHGTPYCPTSQAIVERAHGTLKCVLEKQKRGMAGETPHSRLEKALYTINHLTVPKDSDNPVIVNHFSSLHASEGIWMPRAKVFIWDLATSKWEGLHDLIVWGHGYACLSTDTGVRWLPARHVRPDLRRPRQNVTSAQPSNTDQHADQQPDGPS
ncbi:hypothetical protein Nmel_002618, partial [Mimus melanotis]